MAPTIFALPQMLIEYHLPPVLQIHQAYHHRLFNKTTETSLKFKNNFLQKCVTLQSEYNYLDLSKELKYFNLEED